MAHSQRIECPRRAIYFQTRYPPFPCPRSPPRELLAASALTASRYDSAKDSDPTNGLFRRRGRPVVHETGGKGVGGGGGKGQDSVELTLLSDGGDGGRLSPPTAKRDTSPPPVGVQQPTFYL